MTRHFTKSVITFNKCTGNEELLSKFKKGFWIFVD